MKHAAWLACLILVAAPVLAQETQSSDDRFKAFYSAEWAWRQEQSASGEDSVADQIIAHLPDVGPESQARRLAYWRDVATQLDRLDTGKLSHDNQVNLQVYRAQIAVLIAEQMFRDYEKPLNSDSAFWSDLTWDTESSFHSEQDYRNYLSQLGEFPRYFDQNIANMRAGLKRGFTPPQVTLAGRDASVSSVIDAKTPQDSVYYKPFLTMPATMPEDLQAALRAEAVKVITGGVIPAHKVLLAFLRDDYIPHATTSLAAGNLPDGKAYYKAQIKRYTTLDLTAEEIHNIGLAEVAKIHQEMLDTIAEAKFQGDFPAFLKFLRTDPQFYAKTPDELLGKASYMMKEFDDKSDRYFGYQPRGRFGIHPIPDEVAPYQPAGFGGAGGFQINLYDLPSRPIYAMPALTLHEAAPGHSWAGLIAREHQNPDGFRGGGSAFGEGWALYCERLGTEMDMYHTPYEKFGMLSFQSWRASRLVVDTGMHSMGWTREQAQQFLRENTALSEHDIEEEVDRYISWPGQALSYYLGMTVIQKERQHAQQALGKKFNLRAFHDAILATGGVPLPVLEEYLEAWIKGGGVGPYPEMEK